MSCLSNPCSSTCPPMTVSIQPPPFTVIVPGPSMYCPDRPLCIEQCNPCAPRCPAISSVAYSSILKRGSGWYQQSQQSSH